jgi:hypothetical protein
MCSLLPGSRWAAVSLFFLAGLAGCTPDREQVVMGKWQGDELSATFAAVKMKEDSGASTEEAKNAAKVLATTFVQLKKDKTFTAGMGGAVTEGTWTFNKETGEVLMKISSMKGPDGKEVAGGTTEWTAYLDEDNRRLGFYPAPPGVVKMIKESTDPGAMKRGVSLYKK